MRSILAFCSAKVLAIRAIDEGLSGLPKTITCSNPVFAAIEWMEEWENAIAISTLKVAAQRLRSSSTALAWLLSKAISAVRITRSRITTCSISSTVIAKGESVSNRAWVIPGVSIPDKRIRPVKGSLCETVDIRADYREMRNEGAQFREFTL